MSQSVPGEPVQAPQTLGPGFDPERFGGGDFQMFFMIARALILSVLEGGDFQRFL